MVRHKCRYVDGVLRTLCGEAIGELVDDHFYNSATNVIIAETVGVLAPIAAEEALTEVRAQTLRDQLTEDELQAWMKIIAEETLGELHGVDSQVRAAPFAVRFDLVAFVSNKRVVCRSNLLSYLSHDIDDRRQSRKTTQRRSS